MNGRNALLTMAVMMLAVGVARSGEADPEIAQLAAEVADKGWLVFSARSEKGDWELYRMRPDGSQRHAITNTQEWNEGLPQFSRTGKRLLYRRIKREENFDGNRSGEQGVPMVATSDGSNAKPLGEDGALPWASWSPDGKMVASLTVKGVNFIELDSGRVLGTIPRQGFFQQLTWSPDGKWLSGVSNSFGTGWSVARLPVGGGPANAVSKIDCCTPDWFLDGQHFIYSSRPPGQKTNAGQGWTQLWMADVDGANQRLIFGEDGRHIYGGLVSPDNRYVVFTGNVQEDGDPQHGGAPMGLMRLKDAPIIGGDSRELRALHPKAHSGPVLTLPTGWEPCWTYDESPAGKTAKTGADKP